MRAIISLFVFVFFFTLCGCTKKDRPGNGLDFLSKDMPIDGDTTYYSDERSLENFHNILIYDAQKVEIVTGKPCGVTISGPKCYVKAQEAVVDDGTLTVKFKEHDTKYRKTKVVVHVPSYEDLEIFGSKKVVTYGSPLEEDDVYIELNHVSKSEFRNELKVKELTLSFRFVDYVECRMNCNSFNLTTQTLEQGVFSGSVRDVHYHVDRMDRLDMTGLKVVSQ